MTTPIIAAVVGATMCGKSHIMQAKPSADQYKVLTVTLYREFQTPDFRQDHKLILSVILNRARVKQLSITEVCLQRWQFSYWNRFWVDNKLALARTKIDSEYKRVPATFAASVIDQLLNPPIDRMINHFYCPAAMRPKFSVPGWARDKTPAYETKTFRYYAL